MSNRKCFTTDNPWEAKAGYARAVRIGNHIEVAGTTALEKDKVVGQGNMYEQTLFVFKKIKQAIEKMGGKLDDVVRTRVYVTDINLWEEAARAHAEVFEKIKPVTTILEVPQLIRPDLLIEAEASAYVVEKE